MDPIYFGLGWFSINVGGPSRSVTSRALQGPNLIIMNFAASEVRQVAPFLGRASVPEFWMSFVFLLLSFGFGPASVASVAILHLCFSVRTAETIKKRLYNWLEELVV